MAKKIQDFQIVSNKQLNEDFFVLELFSEEILQQVYPGQFVQVKVERSPETFLRRPFSIHDIDYERNTIKLLIQVAGKGTKTLAGLRKWDSINIIYPLGKSFSIPSDQERILLIGGGCGVAPLLFLARFLKSNGYIFDILMGFKNSNRIIEFKEFKKLANIFLTTEDGSAGEKGLVIHHSILAKNNYDRIYCCGPESMMKAVAGYSKDNNIACEVSLENLMACGIGVCLCCVVNTTKGNICSCTEGPVFNIKDLKW